MNPKQPRPALGPDELHRLRREQAAERQRRGFQTFTRPSVREEVLGGTPGENALQSVHRYSQVRRKPQGGNP